MTIIRPIQFNSLLEVKKLMQQVGVDPYGIDIMLPKAGSLVIKIDKLTCISANILKQEMLSLGGDVAVSRDSLTGRNKKTSCLLIGNLSQYNRLCNKLKLQPLGLAKLGNEISGLIKNLEKNDFQLRLGKYKLNLKAFKSVIMGIVNLTPDSFSRDGVYREPMSRPVILDYAQRLVSDGAGIIDLGGESTRPFAKPVSLKEELARVIPILKILVKEIRVPISVDTYKSEVAKAALDNGASLINDISGFSDKKMAGVIADYEAGAVIMHSKGKPVDMQNNPRYNCLIGEVIEKLTRLVEKAESAGIGRERLIIDPGIGFGKTAEHNLKLISNLKSLKVFGLPVMIGPSRKSFIGKISGAQVGERLPGSIAACVLANHNGANIFRVHDVKEVAQALKVADYIDCQISG